LSHKNSLSLIVPPLLNNGAKPSIPPTKQSLRQQWLPEALLFPGRRNSELLPLQRQVAAADPKSNKVLTHAAPQVPPTIFLSDRTKIFPDGNLGRREASSYLGLRGFFRFLVAKGTSSAYKDRSTFPAEIRKFPSAVIKSTIHVIHISTRLCIDS
jgi:hypothetical protein